MQQSHSLRVNQDYAIDAATTRVVRVIARKKIKLLKKAVIDGKKVGEASCSGFATQWQKTLKQLSERKVDDVISHARRQITNYLLANPHAIVSIAIKLLKNIAEHTDVEITVHSTHAQTIRSSLGEIAIACASTRKVLVVEDDALDFGSLIVKANKSVIDAQIKTQLDKAKELLTSSLGIKNGAHH